MTHWGDGFVILIGSSVVIFWVGRWSLPGIANGLLKLGQVKWAMRVKRVTRWW